MPSLLDKLKQTKGAMLLAFGLLLGLLLIVFGSREGQTEKEASPSVEELTVIGTDEAIAVLERRVSQLLNAMDGVSEATVIITPETTGEMIYATNEFYEGGTLTKREYLLTEADRSESPVCVTLVYPKLRGIAVVCRGGSHPIQQEKIINLLCALFDLSSTDVYVTG